MKKLIRSNVFETNSSSIHTLTIKAHRDDNLSRLKEFDMEHHYIDVGEFGWDFEKYYSPESILSYIYTYACERNSYTSKDPSYLDKLKSMLPDTIFAEPKYDYIGFLDYGFIDHYDQWGEDFDSIFDSKEKLADCLFSGVLATGNDNAYISDSDNFFNVSGVEQFHKGN